MNIYFINLSDAHSVYKAPEVGGSGGPLPEKFSKLIRVVPKIFWGYFWESKRYKSLKLKIIIYLILCCFYSHNYKIWQERWKKIKLNVERLG